MAKKAVKATDDGCDCGPDCHHGRGPHPLVGIAGALGGTLMVAIVVVALAAEAQLGVMIPIAWGFVVLGVVLGFFARKRN